MISDPTLLMKSKNILLFISTQLLAMNQSFQFILSHQQFTQFKQIQKENQKNKAIILDIKLQNENMKLKFQQLEIRCRTQELKIKDLSKNSIRLSRRLLIQQEEHQKTQQNFLNREKQLLKVLLQNVDQHQNNLAFMQKAKETNSLLSEQASALKKKTEEKDKIITSLTTQLAQSKKELKDLQGRCKLSQRQFVQQAKKKNELKVELEKLLIQKQQLVKQTVQKQQQHKQELDKNTLKIQQLKGQLHQNNQSIRQFKISHQKQINQLAQQLILKSQEFDKLQSQKEKLKAKNLNLQRFIKQIFRQFKQKYQEQEKQIKNQLSKESQILNNLIESSFLNIIKLIDKRVPKAKKQVQFKHELQRQINEQLQNRRNQLKKDGILSKVEEKVIIKLQLQEIITYLKNKFMDK